MNDTKITVKTVDSDDQKSVQEAQAELDAKNQAQADLDNNPDDAPDASTQNDAASEITSEQVLGYIEKAKGKKFDSIDDIPWEPKEITIEKEVPLDDDVAAYNRYKKETGRGLADFYKLNALSSDISDDDALLVSYSNQYKYLSPEEVKQKIADEFSIDPDEDSEVLIRKRTFAKKEAIAKAREALESEKQKYSTPLESKGLDLPEEEKTAYEQFKQSKESSENETRLAQERRQHFTDRTNEFFSEDKFEGFKFKVTDDKEIVFKVEDVNSIKENQLNIDNFIGRFIGEDKNLKNISEYHRAIAVGSDPDKFLRFAYEQGRSDQLKDLDRDSKNIDMDSRNTQQSMVSKGGITVKSVEDNTTHKIVIKPKNK